MRTVGAAIALMLVACGAEAQVAREPVCQAEREGEALITRVNFPDGYSVEGPWHITDSFKPGVRRVSAVLDHIVETRPLSGKRETTVLPGAIEMTFSGPTMADVLAEAASVWCQTVLQARPLAPPQPTFDRPVPNKIM